MVKQVRVMRMSVEQPLWRALAGYRVLTMLYAVGLFATEYDEFDRPGIAIAYYVVLCVWTFATLPRVQNAAACTKRFLAVDLAIAITGIVLTPWSSTTTTSTAAAPPCRRYGRPVPSSRSPSRAAGAGPRSPPRPSLPPTCSSAVTRPATPSTT